MGGRFCESFVQLRQPEHLKTPLETRIKNIEALSFEILKVCKVIYKKYPSFRDVFPAQVEYRLSLFLRQLLVWEFFAMFMPQKVTLDPL